MKRVLNFFGGTLLLLTFLSCSLIAVADMFGWLDHLALWTSLKLDINKITLLAVGIIGSSLLIERWITLRTIESHARKSSENIHQLNKIENILSEVSQLRYPTKLLNDRKEQYMSFLRAVDTAPPNSTLDLTHFEKLTAAPFDKGEEPLEELFVKTYKAKVCNGNLNVRQIVHISSIHDLNEVEQRLKMFDGCLNYSLNIMYGFPIVPYLDLAIIHRHWAMIDLSQNPVEPFRASAAFEFSHPRMADTLAKYFEIWWSGFSIPVKNRDGIHLDVLQRLRAILPKTDRRENPSEFVEFIFSTYCDPSIRHSLSKIKNQLARLHVPAVLEAYRKDVTSTFETATSQLEKALEGKRDVDRRAVGSILTDCFKHAFIRVEAVSYDTDQSAFWDSPFGGQLLKENAAAVSRGVEVVRVFILTTLQLSKKHVTLNLLRKQKEAGVKVFYIAEHEMGAECSDLCRDFLIQDNEVLFRMEVSPDGSPVKDGFLTIQTAEIQEHILAFRSLVLKSHEFHNQQSRL